MKDRKEEILKQSNYSEITKHLHRDIALNLDNIVKINPQELRLGNIITNSAYGTDEPVFSIESESDGYYFINGEQLDMWKPIPITEEWLIKLRFERRWGNIYIKLLNPDSSGEYIICDFKTVGIEAETNTGFLEIETKAKYIHQLQNLYYSLTGEELTIK